MGLLRRLFRTVFVGHRTSVVGDIRYRERSTEPLHRALAKRHRGWKDYDVLFGDAAPLRIRCTPQRHYADIVGDHLLLPYRLADPIIRPGMRVLDARCSTGFGAAHLASRVGPAGAVVAFDPDHESIRYARRRYRTGNIAFEIGSIEALAGELDHAFDAIVAVNFLRHPALASSAHNPSTPDHTSPETTTAPTPLATHPIQPATPAARTLAAPITDSIHLARTQVDLAELWRVLAPHGPMLLVQPLREPLTKGRASETFAGAGSPLGVMTPDIRDLLDHLDPLPTIEPADADKLAAIIARKPACKSSE